MPFARAATRSSLRQSQHHRGIQTPVTVEGTIRADADPALIAREYESGGAVAISVLYRAGLLWGFAGRSCCSAIGNSTAITPQRFHLDEYQVYESAAAGADALLLIVAALDDDRLRWLREIAEDELGLDALVEVHTSAEMKRAVANRSEDHWSQQSRLADVPGNAVNFD